MHKDILRWQKSHSTMLQSAIFNHSPSTSDVDPFFTKVYHKIFILQVFFQKEFLDILFSLSTFFFCSAKKCKGLFHFSDGSEALAHNRLQQSPQNLTNWLRPRNSLMCFRTDHFHCSPKNVSELIESRRVEELWSVRGYILHKTWVHCELWLVYPHWPTFEWIIQICIFSTHIIRNSQ